MRFTFLILSTALFLTGCVSSLDRLGYIPKSNLEKEIVTLKAANENDLRVKQAELKSALEKVISGKDKQIGEAANSLYGATLVKPYFKEETRPLLIIYARVEEAKSALGVGPTLKGMQEEQNRLIKELDETLTTLDQLKATNEQKIKENGDLVAQTQAFEAKVAQLEEEKVKIEREGLLKLASKQDELNAANNVIIAKEKENAESRKYIEANKLRISIASGLLAVACIVGAFFSPLFKDKLALAGGVFGAISVGIIFLQPWHVGVLFAISLLAGGAWLLRKTSVMGQVNSNLVNVFQSIKEKSKDLYEKELKPELIEWNTKYLKNGEKIEDKAVTSHIEEILKDYERK